MWWDSLSAFQQVSFIIACAATAILIIQLILIIISGQSDADVMGGGISDADLPNGDLADMEICDGGFADASGLDVDANVDTPSSVISADDITVGDGKTAEVGSGKAFGLRLLSLRSVIAFLAIGGWVCYTACYGMPWYGAVPVAVVCGFIAACGMAAAILGMEKLQTSGNIDPRSAVGKIGTVYLTVPPSGSGRGKVNILVQERYAEYEAITNGEAPLPTASEIKVIGYAGANVLIVEKYKKPSITVENI